jgi:hypothetical protein
MAIESPNPTPESPGASSAPGSPVPKPNDSAKTDVVRRKIDCEKVVADPDRERFPLRGVRHIVQEHRAYR